MTSATTRSEKLDIRLTPAAKQVLQTVAAASARAEETLRDRRRFGLDAEQWAAFQTELDAPPRPLPRLAKLPREPSVFDPAGPE